MRTEESFSPEDEAFFEGAAASAADSVRPVTLDGHAALGDEDDAGAPAGAPDPGRFVRPVTRVVAVLAVISAAALAREALRSPARELAAAPPPLATSGLALDALDDELACTPAHVALTTDDSDASAQLEAGVVFIGPPAPPTLSPPAAPAAAPTPVAHGKPRSSPRTKVASTTVRTAPTKASARTKGVSTAALLHAVRAQHAKSAARK